MVSREGCTEGSETTKLGTDEQNLAKRFHAGRRPSKLNKRLLDWMSKHIIAMSKTAMRIVKTVDSAAIEGKKMPLPGEVYIRIDSWNGEVSRSHSR